MTTTGTLTDRYVDAALRRLPERRRPDIEQELRTSIADAVDDRVHAGEDPAQAEVMVLTELGDPDRLAAGYADQPLHLIGPAYFLDYVRLLRVLFAVVVPAVAAVVGLVRALDGGPVAPMIGAVLGAAVTAGLHVAFWTTLLFALIERTSTGRRNPFPAWTPAQLPEPPSRRLRLGELITETAMTIAFGGFILLSPELPLARDAAGEPVGVLSPWLWDTGVVYVFLALVLVMLAFSFARHHVRWSVPLAVAAALADIAAAVGMIWLASNNRILNPAFVEAVGWSPRAADWLNTGLIILSVLTLIHAVTTTVSRSRRR